MSQLGPNLYDGVTGIAFFFAALAKVTGDEEARAICLRILVPVRRWLAGKVAGETRGAALPQIGGFMGVGSLLYGLLRIAEMLGDEALRGEALALVDLFTPSRIADDRHGRIQTGSAGAILALLSIPREERSDRVMGAARACGDRLLELQVSFAGQPPAWPISPGKPPLVGFCYGAAGAVYALQRLAWETGESRHLEAAATGNRFVRNHFTAELEDYFDARSLFQRNYRPKVGTWRDWWANGTWDDLEKVPRDPDDVPGRADLLPDLWCHGSPGIAAGKIAALPWHDDASIRAEIAAGLRVAAHQRERSVADLCCGDAGRIDVLLFAAQRLGDPNLLTTAHKKIAPWLRRADNEGQFDLSAARGQKVFAPGLFQGLAGVGYVMLRAAEPTLPCILVLE